jgi:FixJ family two-component response regulator
MDDAAAMVHVVDDNESVRRAMSRLLKSVGYRVKAYPSAEALLAELPAADDTPAVVLADLVLPGLDGIALAARLGSTSAAPPVVFLSARGGIPSSVRAMKQGAVDFLEKPVHEQQLLEALGRAVARSRERILERQQLADLRRRYATLTARERQVLVLVVSGLLNKQVAWELGVSEKTVKVHRSRAVAKMGARSLPDLVRMAGRLGLEVEPASGGMADPSSGPSGLPPGHE